MIQDLRYAARSLVRQPSLAVGVVLALAVGVGATMAVVAVLRGVLWESYEVLEPDRVVSLREHLLGISPYVPMSPAEVVTLRREARTLVDIAAVDLLGCTDLSGELPERFEGAWVTENFFSMLGVEAAHGRLFGPGEGGEPVAVLSWQLWQRRFGGEQSLVGRTLPLRWSAGFGPPRPVGTELTVIGVLPQGFEAPVGDPQLWVPRAFGPAVGESDEAVDLLHYVFPFARLAEGVELPAVREEIAAVLTNQDRHPSDAAVHRGGIEATVDGLGQLETAGLRSALGLLAAAVLLVLGLAVANACGLLMGRVAPRRTELALRSALGASGGRLARLQVAESLGLGVLAGGCGFLLASLLLAALRRLEGGQLPRLQRVSLDAGDFALCLLLALLLAGLSSLVPALLARRFGRRGTGVARELRRGSTGSRLGGRLRRALVVTQLALAVPSLLLAAALVDGVQRLVETDLGFDVAPVLTFQAGADHATETPEMVAFHRRLLQRLEALPAVERVSLSDRAPLELLGIVAKLEPELGEEAVSEPRTLPTRRIGPGYFRTLGLPLLAGEAPDFRHLREGGGSSSPAPLWINQSLARQLFGEEDAVGRRLRFVRSGGGAPWMTILGVVADAREEGPGELPQPTVYQLSLATPEAAYLVRARSADQLSNLPGPLRQALQEIDSGLAAYDLSPLDQRLQRRLAPPRLHAALASSYGLVALLLAALGLFAAMSYAVSRRHRELAVRRALGARGRQLTTLVMGEGLRLVLLGLLLGALTAAALLPFLGSRVAELPPLSLRALLALVVALSGTAMVALALPARRALRRGLVESLRQH
ncbi:MAG: ABC transporter permease [Acidobacteriota bacterium]